MTLKEKFDQKKYDEIWQQYCGFFDIDLPEFMEIQHRLMLEQLELYGNCELGKHIMKGNTPKTVEEFRNMVPLTRYDDYADILLSREEDKLPAKPMLWIETTWEGGKNPIKIAPYTERMVNCHRNSSISILLLSTSNQKNQFALRGDENFLYGMAPLPFLTGMVPHLVAEELPVTFLPSIEEAEAMTFSERNKKGFDLGLQKGIDLFFGLSSIVVKMGDSFAERGNQKKEGRSIFKNSLHMNYRMAKAWIKSKDEKRPILPKDIWELKGLVCAGTDSHALKSQIEHYWGIRPLEIFAGTEPACVATESWEKNGLVFFPDVGLYEFIPKDEFEKNLVDPSYVPRTYLIDEIQTGFDYELVVSNFKGGAFARYRTGDIFRCTRTTDDVTGIKLPHFVFVDREPGYIDIAGFTRISQRTIEEAIALSNIELSEWFAIKEFNINKRAFLHMYVEVEQDGTGIENSEVIKEHISAYFRYIDKDFKNIKRFLGLDPIEVTILPSGTIEEFTKKTQKEVRKINPSHFDVVEIKKIARGGKR